MDLTMRRIIALPSEGPNLSDNISAHFGHCQYWVGVEVDGNNKYEILFSEENKGHSACMEPVFRLKEKNVSDFIASGIGGRPFMGFIQLGINIYEGINASLEKNIALFLEGQLRPLGGPSCANHDSEHDSSCQH